MALLKIADPVLVRNVKLTQNVVPGDVIIFGNRPEISSVRAFSGDDAVGLGYFGGCYEGTADGALTKGDECYYNTATGKVTKTATGAYHLGYVSFAPTNCADGSRVTIIHAPKGLVLGGMAAHATTEVTQTQETLTDSTGGTAGTTLAAPAGASFTTDELKNLIASVVVELNAAKADVAALIAAMQTAGLMATSED